MSTGKTHHVALVALLNVRGQILLGLKRDCWGLLGGHVKHSDRERTKTIAREIQEESKLEGVFGQQLIFSCDEQRNGQLYLFDVFVGYNYGEDPPVPLLNEGILEVKWFHFDEAKKLPLTPVTQKAIDFLERKTGRSFVSECVHHFQVVMNLAQSQGGNEQAMGALKRNLDKSIKSLYLINQYPAQREIKDNREEETIFFVDDHREILSIFSDNFRAMGYRVYGFSDPTEALEWVRSKSPTIKIGALVVDYNMPDINGNDFIKEAKPLLNTDTQIVLISGDNIPSKERGGAKFFMKPVSPMELVEAIQKKK